MNLEMVKQINYKNEIFSLDGCPAEDIINLIVEEGDDTDMKIVDDTLYIYPKSGTKGSDEMVDADEVIEVEVEEKPLSAREKLEGILNSLGSRKVNISYQYDKNLRKFIPQIPSIGSRIYLIADEYEFPNEITAEDVENIKKAVEVKELTPLAEILGFDVEKTRTLVSELRKLV